MAVGCLIASAAMLVMVLAAIDSGPEGAQVSSLWVVTYFFLLTLGELFVLPVGLTLIATLSPVRFAATAMGGWYIAKFLGSLLAGFMGAYWLAIPASTFFGLGLVSTVVASGGLLVLSRFARPSADKG
jgi:POT family proton-dependent oligopeptide transporter